MRILVLHNPSAGSVGTASNHLIQYMEACGHTVEVHTSKRDWKAALSSQPDMVAAIGGDGTVGKVARALIGSDVPIGLLPMGTANNVATALGLRDMECEALISSWPTAIRRPFDVGMIGGPWGRRPFLESVGAGLVSETIGAIDEGHAGYVNEIEESEQRIAAALDVFRRTLRDLPATEYGLRLDGTDLSGQYVMVEALNFGAAGPNLHFAPSADAADGLLDLVFAEDHDRKMLGDRLDQFRSDPDGAPTLVTHRGRHIELTCGDCLLHVDDELWRRPGAGMVSLELTVDPGALTFLVPS